MKKVLLGLLVLVVAGILLVLLRLNAYTSVDSDFAGTCRAIEGVPGSEDITIDQNTGIAYISSVDRRDGTRQGAIFGYDLNASDAVPINLTPFEDISFQPHGISLWASPGGPGRLMVISHPARNDRVEHEVIVYEALGMALREVKRIVDPTPEAPQFLMNPNDLVAISPGAFYATNDHAAQTENGKMIEDLFGLSRAPIVFYDGADFQTVIEGMDLPNGISASDDARQIYIGSTMDDAVHVYDRHPDTNALTLKQSIDTGAGVDNIERLPDGSLVLGVHPNIVQLFRYVADADIPSPGKVLAIRWDGDTPVVETLYATDGTELSGLSVAARYGNRMLIGSFLDPHFLDCTLPE
ncbi:MAG: SMP-30/gluconolactonase/LRE family protein [Alphaproteobacteria bacterium]